MRSHRAPESGHLRYLSPDTLLRPLRLVDVFGLDFGMGLVASVGTCRDGRLRLRGLSGREVSSLKGHIPRNMKHLSFRDPTLGTGNTTTKTTLHLVLWALSCLGFKGHRHVLAKLIVR